jgi:hypothetical protein
MISAGLVHVIFISMLLQCPGICINGNDAYNKLYDTMQLDAVAVHLNLFFRSLLQSLGPISLTTY